VLVVYKVVGTGGGKGRQSFVQGEGSSWGRGVRVRKTSQLLVFVETK